MPARTAGRLFLGECKLLRAYLQNIPVGITVIEDQPAVAALAYAVHTMVTMRPWLVFTQPERTIPTDKGFWTEVFASKQEPTSRLTGTSGCPYGRVHLASAGHRRNAAYPSSNQSRNESPLSARANWRLE